MPSTRFRPRAPVCDLWANSQASARLVGELVERRGRGLERAPAGDTRKTLGVLASATRLRLRSPGDALGVLGSAKTRLRLRSPGDALGVLGSAKTRLRLRSPGGSHGIRPAHSGAVQPGLPCLRDQ